MKAMFDALNVVYDEHEKRSFIRLTPLTWPSRSAALVFVLLALTAVVVCRSVLNSSAWAATAERLLGVLRWPSCWWSSALFRMRLPLRTQPAMRAVALGQLGRRIRRPRGWRLVAFSWYVAHFGSYNKTYGSLGAAVGFMTWIWISAMSCCSAPS